jgi:hypothetical protein
MAGSSQLQWIIGATDNASKVFDKVGKEIDKTTTKTDRLRQASQLLGGAAIVGFAASSIKAYADAEQSQMKLQEAYRKFPKIADVSIQSFQELNQALQDKAGADADDLAAGEAKLAMFNLTGTQIKQLIPLVNDLAINQGIGLTDASELVGKAMLGNAKALKSLGIEFKATGDKAKDYATISDLLAEKVGGTGEAFDKTAQGAMLKAQRAFQDLQEEVGKQLVPALSTALSAILPVLRGFNNLSDSVKGPIVWIGALGAAALVLGPRLVGIWANLSLIGARAPIAAAGLEAEAVAATAAGGASGRASFGVGALATSLGKVGLVVGVIYSVAQAGDFLSGKLGTTSAEGEKAASILLDLQKNGLNADTSLQGLGSTTMSLGDALQTVADPSVWDRIHHGLMWLPEKLFPFLGNESGDRLDIAEKAVAGLDNALVALVSDGSAASAAAAMRTITAVAKEKGISVEQLIGLLPGYAAATREAGNANKQAADGVDALNTSLDTSSSALDKVVHGMHDWYAGGNLVAATEKRLAAEVAAHAAAQAHLAHVAAVAHAAQVAAAQAAMTVWNESITAYTSAKDALTSLTDARAQEIKAIGDQLTASGHLNSVFDMNKYTTATERAKTARLGLADAEKAVRDARSDVGKAKTPDELNGAINAEAQANKALAASRAEVAAADKAKAAAALTPGNLLTSIKSKLSGIKSFYNDLVALRKRKLPMSLIRQLIDAGPIEGDQLAKALLSATPSDFNAIINAEAQLDQFGAKIGGIVGDYDYNGLIARQTGVVNTSRANAVAAGNNVAQFRLYLDGREVAVALKAYRASVGGTPLGLG